MPNTLRRKGRNAFWLLGFIVIILGCATAWSILRFRHDSNLVEHTHEVITAVSDLGADVTQAESAVLGFLVSGRTSFIGEFEKERSEAMASSEALSRMSLDTTEQMGRVRRLSSAVSRRLDQLAAIVADRKRGLSTDEIDRTHGGDARQLIAEIRTLIAEATAHEEALLKNRKTQRGWAEVAVLALCGFGTLTSLALMWTGNRSMDTYEAGQNRSRQELERVNAELEQRVLDRTASITRANDELKRSQTELAALAGTLKRSNTELESFAYAATHDLQEPLRTIISFAQLLEKRAGNTLSADSTEYLQTIVGASFRMSELIQGLLDYSRINREPVDDKSVNLTELLELVKNNLAAQIRESGAEVSCGALPELTGNRLHLLQLFQNLMGNSLKYRSPDRPCRVQVDAGREQDFWHIQVHDNGLGFEAEYAEQIFGLFKRLDRTFAGAGVGLALCRSIVERSGGKIWADGIPGQGSTFHFTWPTGVLE